MDSRSASSRAAPLLSSTQTSATEQAASASSSGTGKSGGGLCGRRTKPNRTQARTDRSRSPHRPAADAAASRSSNKRHDSLSSTAIQWDFVERELNRTAAAWDAVGDFFLHVVLVLMFSFYFFQDVNATERFAFRRAIRQPLLTSRSNAALANFKVATFYHDISNAAQYTDYVVNTFLPSMFDITYPTGSGLLLGAVRFRTQRVVENKCKINGEALHRSQSGVLLTSSNSIDWNVLQQTCFGDLGGSGSVKVELSKTFKPRANELVPARTPTGGMDSLSSIASRLWMSLASTWMNAPKPITGNNKTTPASLAATRSGRLQRVSVRPTLNAAFGDTSEEGLLWRYQTCEELRGPSKVTWGTVGAHGSYHCGGFYFDIPFWTSVAETRGDGSGSTGASTSGAASPATRGEGAMNDPTRAALPYYSPDWARLSLQNASRLARTRFLDAGSTFIDDIATRFVATEFYVYQPSLGLFASVRLYAEVMSGGAWVPRTSTNVFRLWTRENSGRAAYSIAFFAVVVLLVVRTIFGKLRRLYHQASRSLTGALLLCNLWDWLDGGVLLLLLVSGSFRIAYLARCAQLHVTLPTLTYAARYPAELDSVVAYEQAQVYINAVITVLLFGRVIRYSGYFFTPLIFLSQVLLAARATLIGVALLLLLGLTTFGLTGYVLLGGTVEEFGSVDRSFRFFFYLLLRQVDVENVLRYSTRPVEVIFFLWAFLMLIGLAVILSAVGILSAAFQAVGADVKVSVAAFSSTSQSEGEEENSAWATRRFRDSITPPTVRWILRRYVLGTLLHPSKYKECLVHILNGRGHGALLHQALRAVHLYRRLQYSVRTTLHDVDSDVMTEGQFMRAVLFHWDRGATTAPPPPNTPQPDVCLGTENDLRHPGETPFHHGLPPSPLRGTSSQKPATPPQPRVEETSSGPGTKAAASDPFVVFFYEEVWAHLCAEWATSMTSKEAVEMQRRVVWATAAVEKVVGDRMDMLQRLPGRLASLEASVTQFITALNDIPVTLA